jgi:hypothetical protein
MKRLCAPFAAGILPVDWVKVIAKLKPRRTNGKARSDQLDIHRAKAARRLLDVEAHRLDSVRCTNTSPLPSSLVKKPNPLVSLKNFTLPVTLTCSLRIECEKDWL